MHAGSKEQSLKGFSNMPRGEFTHLTCWRIKSEYAALASVDEGVTEDLELWLWRRTSHFSFLKFHFLWANASQKGS
jgi:hypothetical protein